MICRKQTRDPLCNLKNMGFLAQKLLKGKNQYFKASPATYGSTFFLPDFGRGFAGNSKMVLGVLSPNYIICPASGTVSYGFIGNNWICIMDNWIASWIVPITGSKTFFYFSHHFHFFLLSLPTKIFKTEKCRRQTEVNKSKEFTEVLEKDDDDLANLYPVGLCAPLRLAKIQELAAGHLLHAGLHVGDHIWLDVSRGHHSINTKEGTCSPLPCVITKKGSSSSN
jgi:hypothetical protein